MNDLERRRWLLRAAWVPFLLGAALAAVEVVQRLSDHHWLDSPWAGALGMWLLAFTMASLSRPR